MLTLANRSDFTTLQDAISLTVADDTAAIIYLETDKAPITITRAEFRAKVYAKAQALIAKNVQARDVVIIAHTQNLESIYLFWGALAIGAIPSMFPTLTEKLDPAIYIRDMAKLVELSDVKVILTSDAFAPTLRNAVNCSVLGAKDLTLPIDGSGYTSPLLEIPPDTIAFLQHSSGTTGLQKGVALAHHAVLNQIAAYSEAIQLNNDDVIASWLPLYHDMGLIAGFLLPLIQGIPLVLMSPFDWVQHPAMLLRAISDYNGTLCWLPNFAYNHMARRIRERDIEGVKLDSMRLFINCSEPVQQESHDLFFERFKSYGITRDMLGVSYAMAENTFAVTQTEPGQFSPIDTIDTNKLKTEKQAIHRNFSENSPITKQVSCGKPIKGTVVCILDTNNHELPERHIGEIAIKSNTMLTEYYKRPDLNPFTPDGWYLTGDMGYIADDNIYVIGRKKDLIINAGKNVYPQDIEAIVNTIHNIKPGRAVVFGVHDEREGTELIAVVAEVTTHDVDERKRINKQIRQQVASKTTVTVSYVTLVDEKWLLKTSSGKIARAANREKWLSERS